MLKVRARVCVQMARMDFGSEEEWNAAILSGDVVVDYFDRV
jgi:hypothetical protein